MPKDTRSPLAALPSVDRLMNTGAAKALVADHGRAEVTRAVRESLAEARETLKGTRATPPDDDALLTSVARYLEDWAQPSLRASDAP